MKILIGLVEHFGDIVACEPVARYISAEYPNSHISWVVRAPFRELIDSNPHIDETIVVDCLTEWIRLSKHSKHDLIVDLHVNYRVCQECRIPLIKQQGNPFVNVYEWFDYGGLLEAFSQGAGLPKLSAQPQVYLNDKHRAAVDALELPQEYCVIHRESNLSDKDWRDEYWRTLVNFIEDEFGLAVVDVGSKMSAPHLGETTAHSTVAPMCSSVIDLLNRTSLLETAEVIRRARFFIGIDSGPAHFANAVKTPGVILMGHYGIFRHYTPFTGFYASQSPEVRIVRNLDGLVAEITVADVSHAVRHLVRGLNQKTHKTMAQSAGAGGSLGPVAPHDSKYRKLLTESGLFDQAWYITHYPEALQNGLDPLDHFIKYGEEAGHVPGRGFDPAWYKTQRPDIEALSDPLCHYLNFGVNEGLRPCPYPQSSVAEVAPSLEAITATVLSSEADLPKPVVHDEDALPRLFAFYLPQFHPIPENNYGHRPGFTEWDNVIKAKPLFKGHYQPRIPGELGYYDLRSIDVMREQVKLANDHGITGFCFYYYYFQGKKLLYKPIDNYVKSDIKAPFFFLWANENWSRRWDGGDNEVIVSQHHSEADNLMFIGDLLPLFLDDRYVKVGGKPILAIYKTHLIPDIQKATDLWRSEVVKHGFPGLYLVMVDDWSSDPPHPRDLGFDASYEIPSNLVPEHVHYQDLAQLGLEEGFEGRVVDYQKFASFHMGRSFPFYKRFRTVMAPWDNTPRYGKRAMVQINSNNDAYRMWLSAAMLDTKRRYSPDERIVFLHSWNEWCEGTYVEPDGKHGRRLLDETRQVVEELRKVAAHEKTDVDSEVGQYYRRLIREKDEGASRSLQAMRQQNMYLYRDLEHHRAQVTRLMTQISSIETTMAQQPDLNAHIHHLTHQIEKLSTALSEQSCAHAAESEWLAGQLAESNVRSAEREQQVQHSAELATQQTLDGILHSKSWRVTKPLRDLAGRLKISRS